MDTPRTHAGADEARESKHFIEEIVAADVAAGGAVHTRFPPEPNGYLHIGHAQASYVSFSLASKYGGKFNLRFDDTNPVKEETEYVEAIQDDLRWLGFDWEDRLYFTSEYFEQLYGWAQELIRNGDAYVCDLSAEETREHRGTVNAAGTNSPYRERGVEENLDLLARMRAGEFPDGARTLKAKIDMASPNLNLRDPVLYRILHAHHHRTGDAWCIYPMYDWAHGQSDAIEHITHSLCSLEFENHRPLYDWFLDHITAPSRPRQIEFARLNISYTTTAKRVLRQLVEGGQVSGWDDPRMPTLRGLRRRGYTPEAVRAFCAEIGLTKTNSRRDMVLLENALRTDLNQRAERRMAVLRPLEVVITNLPEDHEELLEAVNNPEDESAGSRHVPFTQRLWIEDTDFLEDPPRKYFRLAPGKEVRLRYGYVIRCDEVERDADGKAVLLRCTYFPETQGGKPPEDGRKVKGIVHWVSAAHAIDAELRLYDHLFSVPDPMDFPEGGSFQDNLNPDSLEVLTGCKLEPSLAEATDGAAFQFERVGYFALDGADSRPGAPVFNRAVSLRDGWAKQGQ